MFRKMILLLALAGAAIMGPGAVSAHAAASCSTHISEIQSWSIGNDNISGMNHFKCGGAQSGNNGDYYVHYSLQAFFIGGAFGTVQCVNGNPCESQRPTSGLFAGGSDHLWFWSFNPNRDISCTTWRMHWVVTFPHLSESISGNSASVDIGGC